jgi:hypothetical protein
MPKYGMDVRILGLLTSSDYSILSFHEYTGLQESMGKRCAELIYETLVEEGFQVNFTASIYEITHELISIAARLMFGSELKFSKIKYQLDGDICSLDIPIERCPVCNYVTSRNHTCTLLSAFFGRLVQLFFSRFAEIKIDSKEKSCIATGNSYCHFTLAWRIPKGLPLPEKNRIEIQIDEKALKEKVQEIEELDFYKKVVSYARQRRTEKTY